MSFSSRPIPTNKNNPCPVCEKVDGACRILANGTVFCHTLAGAKKFEKVDGYACVAPAKNGHTATFKPDTSAEWSQEKRLEWENRKASRLQAAEEENKVRQDRALSADKRHRQYTKILDELSRDTELNARLLKQGLTQEEIDLSDFKSVKKNQPLKEKYDPRLPGVSKDGMSLVIAGDGYLHPVRDVEGRIVALQIRLYDALSGGRFRWVSTPATATLRLQPEDELPLSVFHPPGGKPCGIAIVEGTGFKPFFVSQRFNYVVIGASGGQWTGSPKLLKRYIEAIREMYGKDLPIKVIPDAGWALNSHVVRQLSDVFDWLKENFSNSVISVLDWNQIHKSQHDIDELEDLSRIRELSLESFLKKYKEALVKNRGFGSNQYQKWAEKRVKLTADIVQDEEWLNIPQGIEKECEILLIRKSLGGGKTQALIKYLIPQDITCLLVGYRNSLLDNTIARANSMGLRDSHVRDQREEVARHIWVNFAGDSSIKLWGGCADSFYKFDDVTSHNPKYYFVHDEICSVLPHFKSGGTLKGRQQEAIKWDVNAIRNAKFVIMMDAYLSDSEVDFIRRLFPEKRIKVLDSIDTINPPKSKTFNFLETKTDSSDFSVQSKFLHAQLAEIAKGKGKVLWISDSQRSCEVADEILTKQGHKHYRLDSKTSTDELSKLLQSNPKDVIVTHQFDSLSLSPSAESGLSIDLFGYFDAVCFHVVGTLGVNSLTQLSGRLRDTNVPIYVACPENVNTTTNPCPYPLNRLSDIFKKRLEMLASSALDADPELAVSEMMAQFCSEAIESAKDPWFVDSIKDEKQLLYEHQNLKLTFKTALAQAGHQIIDVVEEVDKKQQDEVKENKEVVKRREAEKIFNSTDIDYERALELDKQEVNYDVKCQIRKARLKHELPGIEDTPSWNADLVYAVLIEKREFLRKRWRLKQFQNEELYTAVFKNEKKYNMEFGFEARRVWMDTSAKLKTLKLLGIDKIIDTGTFSPQDAWVQEIVDKYHNEPDWFKLIGFSRSKQFKTMVDRFLDYFGLESKLSKKREHSRSYTVTHPELFDEILSDIDDCLDRRAKALIEETKDISLKAIADKAERAEKDRQAELDKRALEAQLTHSDSDLLATFPFFFNNQQEKFPGISNQEPPIEEQWNQPEEIKAIASLLADCESLEMLAELRECHIPPAVFKAAAKGLEAAKRRQIKDWVLTLNG